jgi:hypothetical protein
MVTAHCIAHSLDGIIPLPCVLCYIHAEVLALSAALLPNNMAELPE